MTYRIDIERTAQKTLTRIAASDRDRIVSAVRDLASNPRPKGVKKLTGREVWRIRIGDYRVLYEINDDDLRILVLTIGHRREVYK